MDKSLSSILNQEGEDGESSVYFISKVLKGVELQYKNKVIAFGSRYYCKKVETLFSETLDHC